MYSKIEHLHELREQLEYKEFLDPDEYQEILEEIREVEDGLLADSEYFNA